MQSVIRHLRHFLAKIPFPPSLCRFLCAPDFLFKRIAFFRYPLILGKTVALHSAGRLKGFSCKPLRTPRFFAARAADKLSRLSQSLSLIAKLGFCTLSLFCDFAVIYIRLARKAKICSDTASGSIINHPCVFFNVFAKRQRYGIKKSPIKQGRYKLQRNYAHADAWKTQFSL